MLPRLILLLTIFAAHWLSYEGKLALVPENVRPIKDEEDDDVSVNGMSSKAAAIALR